MDRTLEEIFRTYINAAYKGEKLTVGQMTEIRRAFMAGAQVVLHAQMTEPLQVQWENELNQFVTDVKKGRK